MSAALPNPSAYREDALNALIEIRACHDELRTFLAETFDRLDEVLDRLRNEEPRRPASNGVRIRTRCKIRSII